MIPLSVDFTHIEEVLNHLFDGVYIVDKERKILFWNKGAERITGYSAQDVEGKFCYDNILQHIDDKGTRLCVFGCPLHATLNDGQFREAGIYLHHKQGYRVPISVRVTPLKNKNNEIIGAMEIFSENFTQQSQLNRIEELEKMAYKDPLTQLANRRFIEITLKNRLQEFDKFNWGFGLMIIDIDHFKAINDKYGHDTGDEALKTVAMTLLKCSRASDIIGRWGGDEFLVILSTLDLDTLKKTVQRFHHLVKNSTLQYGNLNMNISISCGAVLALKGDTLDTLIKRADEYLFQSKQEGRNRFTIG